MPENDGFDPEEAKINRQNQGCLQITECLVQIVGVAMVLHIGDSRGWENWQKAALISLSFFFIHWIFHLDDVPNLNRYN